MIQDFFVDLVGPVPLDPTVAEIIFYIVCLLTAVWVIQSVFSVLVSFFTSFRGRK